MQIENIAGICFTTGRTFEDQRDLTIRDGLFRKVVVYYQCVATGITEVFTDGNTGKRSIVAHGSRL